MAKSKASALSKIPKDRLPPVYAVETRVLFLRHQRVMLDADIAELYGVPVKRLNEQVKRNRERFPSDFMFQLTGKERAAVAGGTCRTPSPNTVRSWLQPYLIPSAPFG
jgi:hypothetical protein